MMLEKDTLLPKRCMRLRALRKEKAKTQKEMANLLDVTEKTYRSWEKGEYKNTKELTFPQPELNKLIQLAKFFNCSIDYLIGISDCRSVDNYYISKETGLSDDAISALKFNHNIGLTHITQSINILISDIRYRSPQNHNRSFIELFSNYMNFSGNNQIKYALSKNGNITEARPSDVIDGKAFYNSNNIYFSSKQLEQMFIMEMEDIIKNLKKESMHTN